MILALLFSTPNLQAVGFGLSVVDEAIAKKAWKLLVKLTHINGGTPLNFHRTIQLLKQLGGIGQLGYHPSMGWHIHPNTGGMVLGHHIRINLPRVGSHLHNQLLKLKGRGGGRGSRRALLKVVGGAVPQAASFGVKRVVPIVAAAYAVWDGAHLVAATADTMAAYNAMDQQCQSNPKLPCSPLNQIFSPIGGGGGNCTPGKLASCPSASSQPAVVFPWGQGPCPRAPTTDEIWNFFGIGDGHGTYIDSNCCLREFICT